MSSTYIPCDVVSGGGGGLEEAPVQSDHIDAEVGKMYPVDLATTANDFTLTFPVAPTAGDTFGLYVAVESPDVGGFAQAPGYCIEPANLTKINGADYAAVAGNGGGKYSLWIVGEVIIWRYRDATTGWILEQDGRIAHNSLGYLLNSTNDNRWVNGIFREVTIDTPAHDNAKLLSLSNDRIQIKRTGVYLCDGAVSSVESFVSGRTIYCGITINGTENYRLCAATDIGAMHPAGVMAIELNAGEYAQTFVYHNDSDRDFQGTSNRRCRLGVSEQL